MFADRRSRHRQLRMVIGFAALLALGLGVGPGSAAPAEVATVADQPTTRPAAVPIIELRGTHAEMGAAYGKRCGESIRMLVRDYFDGFLAKEARGVARSVLRRLAAGFEPQIRPGHRAEIRELAAAAGIDPQDALLAQCFPDLVLVAACSTITLPGGAAPDGVGRFGRNLDFPGLGLLERNTVIVVYHPKDAYAFASICFPGMVGVLSGMNEHGLALANMEIHRPPRAPQAMPYMLLYRTVLEHCKTVEEAITFLEKTPRQSTNNLMLMDATGDRAVAEITPDGVKVRRAPKTAALISTNHQRGQDLDTAGRCRRFDGLHTAAEEKFGKVSTETVEEMLAAAAQHNATIQSMVFEPSTLVVHLAVGANAPTHGFVRMDLKPYLRPPVTKDQ